MDKTIKGRFAPSPTGRMHLGNVFAAMLSWLSAKSRGGKWLLRIEDLDTQRSRPEYARMIEDDLRWLGLGWDEGGMDATSADGSSYCQSRRGEIYAKHFKMLADAGLTYRCRCTRADLLAASAPHQSDGRVVYSGRCRPAARPPFPPEAPDARGAVRIAVDDTEVSFVDGVCGPTAVSLPADCGDFIIRRADGSWAYQLAVVVDDALMGVTEVVRGNDLLLSAAQQIYLYDRLGFSAPEFFHVPLVCNLDGRRLSKRDSDLSLEVVRQVATPAQVTGYLAWLAGLIPEPQPITAAGVLPIFDWQKVTRDATIEFDADHWRRWVM